MEFSDDFCPGGTVCVAVAGDAGSPSYPRGTICCFVHEKGKRQLYLLTCGHVLQPPGKVKTNTIVYDRDLHQVGIVDRVIFDPKLPDGMDAGLSKINLPRKLKKKNFDVAGSTLAITGHLTMLRTPGQNWDVLVRGAKTAAAKADPLPKAGKMNDTAITGRFKVVPAPGLQKQNFTWATGDSGAPVYNQAGMLLGMVTSGSGHGGVGVFSIGLVFHEFAKQGMHLEVASWANRPDWVPPKENMEVDDDFDPFGGKFVSAANPLGHSK